MRKITLYIAAAFLIQSVQAQTIDRSKPPKAGPAPVITIADPVIYKLSNGITVLVVENHKLPKVTATYTVDAGPIKEGSKAGIMNLMGQMLNEGTTSKTKARFDEAVDQIGADVSLNSSGGSASALTRYFDQAFLLMADALQHPAFKDESFDKLKSQYITGLKANERNVKAISARAGNALLYGLDHPAGEFATEEGVQKLTLDDAKQYYAKYITPSRGFLTFVGDIKPEAAKALAEKGLDTWKGAVLTLPQLANVKNVAATEIDLVDVPNAVQSEINVANLVNMPMSSPDYFATLIANQILGGDFNSYLNMNLREKHGFTYGARSGISGGRFQTTFTATSSVRNEKTDSAVAEFVKEIKRIRTTPVSAEELSAVKTWYTGNFALGMENASRIATFATNILLNNLPKDFYRTYLQKINAVTAADVQKAAQKYFTINNARIVVTGKASQVGEGLKKLGYPVNNYDKYAKPVTAGASSNIAVPDGKKVVSDFLTAIGGIDNIKGIKSTVTKATMSMQGMNLDVEERKKAPNKTLRTISMGGNVVSKEVFDGNTGFRSQGPNQMPLTDDELKEKKIQQNIIEQVDYVTGNNYKLATGKTEKVDGKDAYVVTVTVPSGKTRTEYYDVNTHLLVKSEQAVEVNGMNLLQTVELSDYRKVNAVMMPYKINLTIKVGEQQQNMEMNVTDMQMNTEVADTEFK
ncbi:insulinase family protein [Danxiaibacter flavus]|uniref:Insulinase family protein n=1 Tax=Danxiaibacter flavus TaxID=3049108 RepID=A0ABV3Z8G5_9BACT|nr:insulinase family protein [Chitinophagaceae bacterium DXS]